MEARLVDAIPREAGYQYEPKWDGFRCLAFCAGGEIELQSKSGQPLARYFPEIVERLRALGVARAVLDGELVVPVNAVLAFDELLQRIHPAASRVAKLAQQRPATYMLFDILLD
jgi:ATP-dependent DNA ligase